MTFRFGGSSFSARHSSIVGYNVQGSVDTEAQIIVTYEVINKGFDRDQLNPMAIAVKDALQCDHLHTIADKGYFSGPEILEATQRLGRADWKRWSGYHVRSRVETRMKCLKAFGERIASRDPTGSQRRFSSAPHS